MPDRDTDGAALLAALRRAGPARERLVAVLGASIALVDHLVSHPEHWRCVAEATAPTARGLRETLVAAVASTTRGPLTAYDALRIAYRRELLAIAALDLTSRDPVGYLPTAAEQLAWLAEAALEAALAIAREEYGEGAADARLAVIGMGKTGGGELNYVSDVDVIFVAEPAEGVDEERALTVATALAAAMMKACSAQTGEGTLWPVDAALRPEGKAGPLVRTVASHRAYYERWAKTWEFQALLKAWVSAGDFEVGRAYKAAISPMVWEAAGRDNFVEDVQAMRRRVEQHVPAGEAGPAAQARAGRPARRRVLGAAAAARARARRPVAAVGHDPRGAVGPRQGWVHRSRRRAGARRGLPAAAHPRAPDPAAPPAAYPPHADVRGRPAPARPGHRAARQPGQRGRRRCASRARARSAASTSGSSTGRCSASAAKLTSADVSLTPEAARARLAALGFRDPAGAMRHLEALTTGVSRRAAIQRTLLPVMLGWFADEADPDAGLLAFRRVSEELGAIHWYLKMLRDEGSSAERLARALSRSRYAADLLVQSPESVAILGEAGGLTPRSQEQLTLTLGSAAGRQDDPDAAMAAVLSLRRHELFRVAVADLAGEVGIDGVGTALSDLTGATLHVALGIAERKVAGQLGEPLGTRIAVIGMGSLGGREMGYASDADVVLVHRATGEVSDDEAQRRAVLVVQEVRRLLGAGGPGPPLLLDNDLRPEGKRGPLTRSLAAYATYYRRWAATWEFQALLRARPVAGDPEVGAAFMEVIEPVRYPEGGLTLGQVRDIRLMKARVESERLPRGADKRTHLKLGVGGLTDVEWTVQLIQLQHGAADPALRTTGTMAGLTAAELGGYLDEDDAASLRAALAPRHLAAQRLGALAGTSGGVGAGRPARRGRHRPDHRAAARRTGDFGRRLPARGQTLSNRDEHHVLRPDLDR